MLTRFTCEREGLIGPALLRIGLATIMFSYYLLHFGVRSLIWGAKGQLDYQTYVLSTDGGPLALYRYSPSALYTDALFIAAIVAAAAFALGLIPRVTCWLFAITTAATVDRNSQAIDAGQTVVVLLAFILCFMDTGRFSLFRVHLRLHILEPILTMLHNAGRFLITWQMAMIYFWAAFYKLSGSEWRDGTAMYYVLHLQRFLVFPSLSAALAANGLVVATLTYSTVLFQMVFPFLIWNRRTKPFFIAAGVTLHGGIAILLGLYAFSLTMIVAEVSLLSDQQFLWTARWLRARHLKVNEDAA